MASLILDGFIRLSDTLCAALRKYCPRSVRSTARHALQSFGWKLKVHSSQMPRLVTWRVTASQNVCRLWSDPFGCVSVSHLTDSSNIKFSWVLGTLKKRRKRCKQETMNCKTAFLALIHCPTMNVF